MHGYSGTATFVRQTCRPIDAIEGFSSLCCLAEVRDLLQRLDLFGASTALSEQRLSDQSMEPQRTQLNRKRPLDARDPANLDWEKEYEHGQDDARAACESRAEVAGLHDVLGGGLFRLLCDTSPDHLRALDSEVLRLYYVLLVTPVSEEPSVL